MTFDLFVSTLENLTSTSFRLKNMPIINPAVEAYGWTAVPRDLTALISSQSQATGPPKPILASSVVVPGTVLAKEVLEYAKKELPIEVFNHSMRVYYYGIYSRPGRVRTYDRLV